VRDRLGQLSEEDPRRRSGCATVPVAVLEKGKQPARTLLSGAVVNPRGSAAASGAQRPVDELPFLGEVAHESVYFMTA
jgi:hypothetical protein